MTILENGHTPDQLDIIERNTPLRAHNALGSMDRYHKARSLLIDAAVLITGLVLLLWWVM